MASRPRPTLLLAALLTGGCFNPEGNGPASAGTGTGTTAGTDATTTATTTTLDPTTTEGTTATSATSVGATATSAPVDDQGAPVVPCAALDATDLGNGLGGLRIDDEGGLFGGGLGVDGIGDFNGDGRDDLRVLGLPKDNATCGATSVWRNYLVFGTDSVEPIALGSSPAHPFLTTHQGTVLAGVDACDPMNCMNAFGVDVAGLGDRDLDGHADIGVTAPLANTGVGRQYVLHGRPDDGDVVRADQALADLKDLVFEGTDKQPIGLAVSRMGDLDGDEFPDLAFHLGGTPRAVQVVYGGFGLPIDPIKVDDIEAPLLGFKILDPDPDGVVDFGFNLDGGHDFNSDGTPDLLLDVGPDDSRRLSVVLGAPGRDMADSTLDELFSAQTAFSLACAASCGSTARFVGDLNGDGFAEIAAGEWDANNGTGRVVVLFGNPAPVNLNISDLPGNAGFILDGEPDGMFGYAVAGADVDGDQIDDLVIGAPNFDSSRGRVYVVFGRPDLSEVTIGDVVKGAGGYVIDGPAATKIYFGSSVAGIGRFNADGLADLAIGAPGVTPGKCVIGELPGATYVVFGHACGR